MTLVSIIIPVFNKVSFINATLDSALEQTYSKTEIILVNDGSNDGSLEVLKEYAERFSEKIKLINSINLGACAARNLGILHSSGEYIQFLDADDILSPDKIKNQIDLIGGKSPQVVASCEWVIFDCDITHITRVPYGVFCDFPSGLDWLLRAWNYQEMMANSSWLVHKDLILKAGPWNENLIINQDGEFFCRVLLNCTEVVFDTKSNVYYRSPGAGNISRNKSRRSAESLLNSYKSYELEILKVEDSNRVRLALKKVYQKFIYDIFPEFPDLVKEAEYLMENLNVFEKTYIGGPKFQRISKIVGFKNALRLKRLFQ